MALAAGTRLGAYEVAALVGAGGMGEVYRARDTKLQRDVALKILPELFAADPERLARFRREAQLLASLNHPNIAGIYGFEDSGAVHALALEFVDGPTLADLIERRAGPSGPAGLPLDEALPIARQIAEALEAAHEQGIVHRDLKPANIKVRPDGTVKVLDFGLAKAFEGEPAAAGLSVAPTITSPAATRLGTILGTAAYMSPEQARGKGVDKRTDIWAFGCVLYEMLTGRRAFAGEEVTDVLARVLERQPDLGSLPSRVPDPTRRLLERCFEKDPRRRLRDIGEARLVLEGSDTKAGELQVGPNTLVRVFGNPRQAAWALAAVLLAGLLLWGNARRQENNGARPDGISRFVVPVESGFELFVGQNPSLTVSPDGRTIIFETGGRLHRRLLDRFDSEPIPGTEGGTIPFFSPDGEWLGFARSNALMKMPVAGGPPLKIADAYPLGASWGVDNQIIFAGALGNGGLWRVPADGGIPQQVTVVSEAAKETQHLWPDALPNGGVLYTVLGPSGHAHDARLVVHDLAEGERRIVAEGVTYGRYVPPGFLVFANADGTLFLQPYDLGRGVTGPARAVLSGARTSTWGGAVSYAVSASGNLVYFTGTELEESHLTQLDVTGRELRRFGSPGAFYLPMLSPDGRTVATTIRSVNNDDIYLLDVASGRFDRFSFDGAEDESPVWSPDGRRIAYSSASVGEQRNVIIKSVDSSDPDRIVFTGKRHLHLTSWSPDGRWLAFYEFDARSTDVRLLDVNDPSRLLPVATSPAGEWEAVFSPDGRWLAYRSNETGRDEVYVVSFPGLGNKQQVSRNGGVHPRWSATGQELFFVEGGWWTAGRMMTARRAEGRQTFSWRDPVPLFDISRFYGFDVARDGRSFYFVSPNSNGPARQMYVVVNWLQEATNTPQ